MMTTCDNIIGYVNRILCGIEVTSETLATEVIHEVGTGGNFLATEHTAAHDQDQFWFPAPMDRSGWTEWEAAGNLSMGGRA